MLFEKNVLRRMLIKKIRESLADLRDEIPTESLCEFRGDSGVDSTGSIVSHSQNSYTIMKKNNAIQTIEDCLRAIEKVSEGTYGECDECDDNIVPGRLTLHPHSVLCTKCKSGLEEEAKKTNGIITDSGPRSFVHYEIRRKVSDLLPRIHTLAH